MGDIDENVVHNTQAQVSAKQDNLRSATNLMSQ